MRHAALPSLALVLLPSLALADGVEWQRCNVGPLEARCTSIEVPERRDVEDGRSLEIPVVELPATGASVQADPIVVLEGGPGASVSRFPLLHAQTFAGARRHRPLLLVDQRGTGRSAPLRCDALKGFRSLTTPEAVATCRQNLEPQADLAYYTTEDVIRDLADLLDRLGYERVNLFGTSYGTRTALRFLARYPERVRSMILLAPYPTTHNVLVEAAPVLDGALVRLAETCAADAECRHGFPHLDQTLEALPARHGDADGWPLFAAGVRMMLFFPLQAARLPQIADLVARSDRLPEPEPGPQADLLADWISEGAFLSILCSEDAQRTDVATVRRASADTFLGPGWGESLVASCAEWPRRPLPPNFSDPVEAAVPALLLVGENDPAMPPAWAHEAAATLPNGRVVEVPDGQHSFLGMRGAECIVALIESFLTAGSAESLDTACLDGVAPPPFVPPASSAN